MSSKFWNSTMTPFSMTGDSISLHFLRRKNAFSNGEEFDVHLLEKKCTSHQFLCFFPWKIGFLSLIENLKIEVLLLDQILDQIENTGFRGKNARG